MLSQHIFYVFYVFLTITMININSLYVFINSEKRVTDLTLRDFSLRRASDA